MRPDGRELERLDFIVGRLLDLALELLERLDGLYPGLRVVRDLELLRLTAFELDRVVVPRVRV